MHDEVVGVVGVDRVDGDAGAGAGQDRSALKADRLVDAAHDALGDHVDVFGCAGALQDHHELVATEPHADVGSTAGLAHALGGDHQHIVAGGVAERVVDLFEAVEVDLDDCHALVTALGALDQRIEMIGEEGAIVKPGQPVMHGEERHGIARVHQLVRLAQDDVRHRAEDEQRDQDDDADGRIEKRPMQGERAFEAGVGERADAVAQRREPFKGGVGHGFVEHCSFLACEIAGAVHPKLGFQRRDEAPAIRRKFRREQIDMIWPAKQHAFDGLRIEAGGRHGIGGCPLQQDVIVRLELRDGLSEGGDQRTLILRGERR